jgi:hypothetical protein
LILGRRSGTREIDAVDAAVHKDLFSELRKPCEALLQKIEQTSARQYEAHAAIEPDDEHFVLELDHLPKQPEPRASRHSPGGGDEENHDRTAALVRTLRSPLGLRQLDARGIRDFKAMFYSIAFQQADGSWINFIKKTDPRRLLKPGRLWLRYEAPLRRVEEPDLVVESEVDVVLGPTHLASFSGRIIKDLFTDVHLALQQADGYVDGVASALGPDLPISDESLRILRKLAGQKFSIARRLYLLQEGLVGTDIKPSQIRAALLKHKIEPTELINENDQFIFDETSVSRFLDVLEERYFETDWTNESRRADRFSRRS